MKRLFTIFALFSLIFTSSFAVKATNFQLKDQFSKVHSLENYQGKKVFLIFWATWCEYCQEELEVINKLYNSTGKNEKDIVFLTFNSEEKKTLNDFLKEKKYKFPIINDETIFLQYYIDGYPTTYILDETSEVVQSIHGKIKEENFKNLIEDIHFKIKDKNK